MPGNLSCGLLLRLVPSARATTPPPPPRNAQRGSLVAVLRTPEFVPTAPQLCTALFHWSCPLTGRVLKKLSRTLSMQVDLIERTKTKKKFLCDAVVGARRSSNHHQQHKMCDDDIYCIRLFPLTVRFRGNGTRNPEHWCTRSGCTAFRCCACRRPCARWLAGW